MDAAARRRLGLVLLVGAAVAFSTAGFFTRLIAADLWTMLFWRGVFSALLIAGYLIWRHGAGTMAAFRAIGRPGCLVVLCSTISMVAFISALRLTTVANVAVIYATSPLLAAFVAWLWSRERSSAGTLLASLAAGAGVIVMVGGSAGRGDLRGDLLALLMTLALAVMMVILRHHRAISMVPAACLSTVLTAAVAWPLASPLSVTPTDLVYLALFGVTQTGLGLILLTLGSRWVSPAENAPVGALDAPLAPIWVWLAFDEVPPAATLLGGLIVLDAVLAHLLVENRSRRWWRRAASQSKAVW